MLYLWPRFCHRLTLDCKKADTCKMGLATGQTCFLDLRGIPSGSSWENAVWQCESLRRWGNSSQKQWLPGRHTDQVMQDEGRPRFRVASREPESWLQKLRMCCLRGVLKRVPEGESQQDYGEGKLRATTPNRDRDGELGCFFPQFG